MKFQLLYLLSYSFELEWPYALNVLLCHGGVRCFKLKHEVMQYTQRQEHVGISWEEYADWLRGVDADSEKENSDGGSGGARLLFANASLHSLISSTGEICPAPGVTAKVVRQARTA